MSYHTETYPVSIDVRVTLPSDAVIGDDPFEDAIKGNDEAHAMERAEWNWPGAEIEFLGITQDDEVSL
jgi:hypothetical protein